MHATERWRNVTRTVIAHIAGLTYSTTTPIVPGDDDTFNSQTATRFVRVTCKKVGGVFNGIRSGRKTHQNQIMVIAECYARTPGAAAVGGVDAADQVADVVATGLTFRDLTLIDYVADSSGATVAGSSVLRFFAAPEIDTPPSVDGWGRRIVTTTGLWWAEHEA